MFCAVGNREGYSCVAERSYISQMRGAIVDSAGRQPVLDMLYGDFLRLQPCLRSNSSVKKSSYHGSIEQHSEITRGARIYKYTAPHNRTCDSERISETLAERTNHHAYHYSLVTKDGDEMGNGVCSME